MGCIAIINGCRPFKPFKFRGLDNLVNSERNAVYIFERTKVNVFLGFVIDGTREITIKKMKKEKSMEKKEQEEEEGKNHYQILHKIYIFKKMVMKD